jgi:DNA-binding transcriptional regulator YbjK
MPRSSVNVSGGSKAGGEGRRREILDAALGLIAEQGVDSVTHRRVAAAAGVALGSTTYYFDSREHMLREAFRRYLEVVSSTISALSAEAKRNPSVEGLVEFLVQFTEREFQNEALLITEFELMLFAARDGSLAEELHSWQDGLTADLAEALESLGAARPFDAAHAIIHLVRGYEQEQLTRGEARSEDLRRRLEVLLRAYLAPA